jgi:hypothetical protein
VVTGNIRAPLLVRGDDSHVTATDVIADRETRSAKEEAMEWLRTSLADGPVSAAEVKQNALKVGIADTTLRRAKVALKVRSEQNRANGGISEWIWRLDSPSTNTYTLDHIDHVGHLDHVGVDGQGGQDDLDSHRYTTTSWDRQLRVVRNGDGKDG